MRTQKQQVITRETVDVYASSCCAGFCTAQFVHRLGVVRLKGRLEDLAFKSLRPAVYKEIAGLIGQKLAEREVYTNRMVGAVQQELNRCGIEACVHGRPKHIYSIYQKIHQKGTPFEAIFDLTGVRILVNTTGDCYAVLERLHDKWEHIPERFRDFIERPKANGYQSLHTTIRESVRPVEVQIRTHEMHKVAEYGSAAHWRYKEEILLP